MKRYVIAATLGAAALVAPAGAQEPAPAPGCYGLFFTDKTGDAVRSHPAFAGEPGQENLDLVNGFFNYDASQGDAATTVNIRVKNLDKTVPEGSTSVQWQAQWTGSAGVLQWVRAVTDFSGIVTYDYGGQEPTPATTFNVRQGGTTGAFFEGPDGIVQIVIPASVEPKGTVLKGLTVYGYEPVQALPGAAPTPVKGGQLYEQDSAGGKGTFTIGGPCPEVVPETPAPANAPGGGAPTQASDDPLPVTVRTRSARRGKRITLKVRASQPITKLAAQLKKGKKVFAKGARAKLNGSGRLKLKVTRKLRKGTYVLDLAGTDASGARRFTAARLKIR